MAVTKWFEYVCVECDFTMLLPDDGGEVPGICPGCYDTGGSLMYVQAREVGKRATDDDLHEAEAGGDLHEEHV